MRGVHLAVLCGFALAQPLFDVLARNPGFFAVRGASPREIVAFAAVVTLGPPALLLGVELAARAVSGRLARVVHLTFVGSLVGLLALAVESDAGAPSGAAALALAVVAGLGAAAAYARTRLVPALLTVLAPAPLLFAGLFLLSSPVSELVRPAHAGAVAATSVTSPVPVVVVVMDELSTVSLMGPGERLDAARYPAFADLARDATWYRNATTVSPRTETAVPAILTGLRPTPGQLPVLADHPRNLFTLLRGQYRLEASEPVTRLCPPGLCHDEGTRAVVDTPLSLASDASIVFLHRVLPQPYDGSLPSIDDSWGNFAALGAGREAAPARPAASGIQACGRGVCAFADRIRRSGDRTLYFLHTVLPHIPYVFLPSGHRYAIDVRGLRGDEPERDGSWPRIQDEQRYLLQLGYADRALGLLLRNLRRTGLYDRALVIVTADHGVSYRYGAARRAPTTYNLADIAFVPLFVKLPNQRRGRVDDGLARTVDVLPTIADVVGARLPWRVDGRSLAAGPLPADGSVEIPRDAGHRARASLSALRRQRRDTLARQLALFGSGSSERLYRIGPHTELLGRTLASLRPRLRSGPRVELDDRRLLSVVDRRGDLVPAFIEGGLAGYRGRSLDLAVAVNGRVAAVTATYGRTQARFSALVPERALRSGDNEVQVLIVRQAGRRLVLEQLPGGDAREILREQAGGEVVESSEGGSVPLERGAVTGGVRVRRTGTGFYFTGTARDDQGRPALWVSVFVGGESVYRGRLTLLRTHRILGEPPLPPDAFAFELPPALLPAPGSGDPVRVVAFRAPLPDRKVAAAELAYRPGFPWRH